MKGIIYKITNLKNDKCYVGLTAKSLDHRIKEHLKESRNPKYHIHRAINKYGWGNFKVDIIENDIPIVNLGDREKYWIKYFNSYYEGYNATKGGDGTDHTHAMKKVYQYDLGGNFIAEYKSVNEAGRQAKINYKKISACALGNNKSAGNFQWRYFKEKKIKPYKIEYNPAKKKIIQYDLNGNFIQVFDSIIETGIRVAPALKNPKVSAGGFLWRYYEENFPKQIEPYKINDHSSYSKTVVQISLDGYIINEYKSITEASKQTEIHRTNINRCLKGKRPTAGGYKWEYKNVYK